MKIFHAKSVLTRLWYLKKGIIKSTLENAHHTIIKMNFTKNLNKFYLGEFFFNLNFFVLDIQIGFWSKNIKLKNDVS